jgi:hypothetical protein
MHKIDYWIELAVAKDCLSDIGWSSETIEQRIAAWNARAEATGTPMELLPKAMQAAFVAEFNAG